MDRNECPSCICKLDIKISGLRSMLRKEEEEIPGLRLRATKEWSACPSLI